MSIYPRIPFLLTLSLALLISPSNGDWDDWLWPSEDEDTTTTIPVTPKPKRFTEQGLCDHDPLTFIILKFILDTKKLMADGTVAPGLPPLEPFYIPKMNMELVGSKHDYRVVANITEINVAGLSTFEITGIESNVLDMSINVSVFIPSITISGKYHFKGTARVFVPLPVYAKGRVTIESKQVQGTAILKIGWNDDFDMVMEEFDFHLDLEEVNVKFKGFTGAMISSRWNAIINSMGLKMFRKMEPKIHEKVRERAILGVNKAFKEWEYDWALYQEIVAEMVSCWFE